MAATPHLPEALFNRALALEKLGLRRAAANTWTKYLALDSGSGWADEARRRRAGLTALPEPDLWAEQRPRLVEAVARHDQQAVEAVVSRGPGFARRDALETSLPAWAKARAANRMHEAETHLAAARAIGGALFRIQGDAFVRDVVAEIERPGPRRGDRFGVGPGLRPPGSRRGTRPPGGVAARRRGGKAPGGRDASRSCAKPPDPPRALHAGESGLCPGELRRRPRPRRTCSERGCRPALPRPAGGNRALGGALAKCARPARGSDRSVQRRSRRPGDGGEPRRRGRGQEPARGKPGRPGGGRGSVGSPRRSAPRLRNLPGNGGNLQYRVRGGGRGCRGTSARRPTPARRGRDGGGGGGQSGRGVRDPDRTKHGPGSRGPGRRRRSGSSSSPYHRPVRE